MERNLHEYGYLANRKEINGPRRNASPTSQQTKPTEEKNPRRLADNKEHRLNLTGPTPAHSPLLSCRLKEHGASASILTL